MPRGGAVAEGAGSVALAGDAVGSVIVTGTGNTVKLDLGGIDGDLLNLLLRRAPEAPSRQPRPTPVRARPPAFADHLDRVQETATILERAAPGAPVNVYGDEGVGKTYLLTHAANQPGGEARDGVVFLDGREGRRADLLQQLFDELFDCRPPCVQPEAQNRRDLRDREVLVFIDSFELDRDEAQRLFAGAPGCRFVVGSTERTVWEGTPLRIGGLDPADSLAIFEREMGPLAGPEEKAAEAIAAALGHNPLAIRQAASVARDDGIPLAEVAGWLAGAAPGRAGLVDRTLEATTPDERQVLTTLAAFGSAPVGTEHLAAITDVPDVHATLSRLERRRLVGAHSPRYSLSGVSAGEVRQRWSADVDAQAERATGHFAAWASERRGDLAGLLVQSEALLAMLRSAVRDGRSAHAVDLGRALSAVLSWSRRWAEWREVLEVLLDVGRMHDVRTESWALHQLGTRAVALGEVSQGVALLREALALREAGASPTATALTRHNLEVALGLGAPPRGRLPRHLPLAVLALLAVAAGVAGLAYLVSRPETISLSVATTGRGTVSSTRGGIDCGATCTARLRQGTRVTLTATAGRGAVFAGWEGGGCSGTKPCTITVDDDAAVRARFDAPPTTRLLTVTTGGGRGSITSTPSGIDCGSSCTASFADGARVTLSATAAKGAVFTGWEAQGGACAGTGPCTITLRRDTTIGARFEAAAATHVLTVRTSGDGGTVTSEPTGIDCGRSCRASYAEGTTVTLTPSTQAGAVFSGWRGAECPATGTCTVTMSGDRSVTATFQPSRSLTVAKSGPGGTVTSKPSGIDCGATCTAGFTDGATVTLVASDDSGVAFTRWSGPCQGKPEERICVVRLTVDTTVKALFTPIIR